MLRGVMANLCRNSEIFYHQLLAVLRDQRIDSSGMCQKGTIYLTVLTLSKHKTVKPI